MRFRHRSPDARLRDLVQGYWELEGLHLDQPVQNADFPERTVRLLFSASPTLMGHSVDALRPLLPVTVSSFSLQPQVTFMQGSVRVLVAELYPWGARQLLGWHADLAPGALDEALSASSWGREVVGLLELGEWVAARAALEAQLLRLHGWQADEGTGVQAAQQIYKVVWCGKGDRAG